MKSNPSPCPHDIPSRSEAESVAVSDVMCTDIVPLCKGGISIPANANVAQAAAIMAYERLPILSVVDALGRPLGTVSSDDLLRWIAASAGYVTFPRS